MSESICKSCKVRPRAYRKEICEFCAVDKSMKLVDLADKLKRMRDSIQAQQDVDSAMRAMRLR
jgi:hypothetical protein